MRFQGKVIGIRGPKNDMTRSVHVWLQVGNTKHDFVIYDNSDLIDALKARKMQVPKQLCSGKKYEALLEKASRSLTEQLPVIEVEAIDHIIQDITIMSVSTEATVP